MDLDKDLSKQEFHINGDKAIIYLLQFAVMNQVAQEEILRNQIKIIENLEAGTIIGRGQGAIKET